MTTVLEEYSTERQCSLVCFLSAKGHNSKVIHKEMFPGYGGKYLSHKAVQNWVANVSVMTKRLKRRCRVVETTVKRLLCCGFRRTGKAMGQVYQFWWRTCREIIVFSFDYYMFFVLYPFVTYLLTLPRTCQM
jgi:hypothetical protein